ncbi:hypothetical protein EP7_002495 [Isosphaeraceae bacterium EP7]
MTSTLFPTFTKLARMAPRINAFPEASRRSKNLLALLVAWLLFLPAIIGLVEWRRMTFSRISAEHGAMILDYSTRTNIITKISVAPGGRILSPSEQRKDRWHAQLAAKYADAAACPWLPVWPDPPEPD